MKSPYSWFWKVCVERPISLNMCPYLSQGSQFRTVLAGIYRTGQCTGTDTPCFVLEKIPAVPAVSAGKWILGRNTKSLICKERKQRRRREGRRQWWSKGGAMKQLLFLLLLLLLSFFSSSSLSGLSISLSFFSFSFFFLLNFVMYGLVSHFLFLCFVLVFEFS